MPRWAIVWAQLFSFCASHVCIRVYNLTSISRWVSDLAEGCSLHMEIAGHCPEILFHLINRHCSAMPWINVIVPAPGDVMTLHCAVTASPYKENLPCSFTQVTSQRSRACCSFQLTSGCVGCLSFAGSWMKPLAYVWMWNWWELTGSDRASIWVELVPSWPGIMVIHVFI